MIIVEASPTFLSKGAIVPTDEELDAMVHALIEERDRVIRGHGTHYGHMTIERVNELINDLEEYRKQRGA